MNNNRRNILKSIIYYGASAAIPASLFTSLTRDDDLLLQSRLKINNLGDDMYEIDGWIVPLSDLRDV